MDWHLCFEAPQPPQLSELHRVLSTLAGCAPVKAMDGKWSGNPRDGYSRSRLVSVASADGSLWLRVSFSQMGETDDDDRFPGHDSVSFSLTIRDAQSGLAAWNALAAALAILGYADTTFENCTRPIVDALLEAGLEEAALGIRRKATEALAKRAPAFAHVTLDQTSPDDLDVVLESYDRPEAKSSVSLCSLGLETLPRPLARFRHTLSLPDSRANPLKHSAFRGLEKAELPGTDPFPLSVHNLQTKVSHLV